MVKNENYEEKLSDVLPGVLFIVGSGILIAVLIIVLDKLMCSGL